MSLIFKSGATPKLSFEFIPEILECSNSSIESLEIESLDFSSALSFEAELFGIKRLVGG